LGKTYIYTQNVALFKMVTIASCILKDYPTEETTLREWLSEERNHIWKTII